MPHAVLLFTEIREPYLCGVTATSGGRVVEIIRTDSCVDAWMVFATIDGCIVRASKDPANPDPTTRRTCMTWARRFLWGEINPLTWKRRA